MSIQKNVHTTAEFEAWITLSENANRRFELLHGEIIEKMPTQLHAAIVSLINFFLMSYLRNNPLGWALVEARYQLPGDEHNARLPDVSYVSGRNRPLVRKGPAPYMPDLAVEVKSPDDGYLQMRDKATYYLANGSQMVWLVFPEKQIIEVYRPDMDVEILTEGETINGYDVLPGFTLAVQEIFAALQ